MTIRENRYALRCLLGEAGLWSISDLAELLPGDPNVNRPILKASPKAFSRGRLTMIRYGHGVAALEEHCRRVARQKSIAGELRRA